MPIHRHSRRSTLLAALLLPVLAFAACGGDDDSADEDAAVGQNDSGETTTTAAAAEAGGTGTGTFTVAGTEYTFQAEPCSIGGDDAQPEVEAQGKGTADGKAFTVVFKRSPSKSSVIENFQLVFSLNESMVGTNFVGLPEGAANSKVKVEGQKATGTFTVLGSGGRPSGEGTVVLTCEK
jgi:type 1 fimbria pilin